MLSGRSSTGRRSRSAYGDSRMALNWREFDFVEAGNNRLIDEVLPPGRECPLGAPDQEQNMTKPVALILASRARHMRSQNCMLWDHCK
jgi:hypothetical protein